MLYPDAAALGKMLGMLLDRGVELPLYFAAIAVNGSMCMGRYERAADGEHLNCVILGTHVVDDLFAEPLHILVTDRRGEAARVTLAASGPPVASH
jgi:hypothetical protein